MKCLSLVEIFFSFLLFSIGIFFVCENVLLNLRRKLREDRLRSSGNTKVNFVFHSLALSLQEKTPRRQAALVAALCLPGWLMIISSKGMRIVRLLFVLVIMAFVLVSCRAAEYCNCG